MTDASRPSQIDLGHALITLVEPTRDWDRLVEYNRWYEHDHAYAGLMAGPGAFAYRRFVATRDLKALRLPRPSTVADPVEDGSFIGIYWFAAGAVDEHYAWAFPQTAQLAKDGRMNSDRSHVSTSLHDVVHHANRPGWPVPIEVALDHPYQGLLATWTDRVPGVDFESVTEWERDELVPAVLAGSAAAQAMTAIPRDFPGIAGSGTGVGERVCTLWFLDQDPRERADSLIAEIVERTAASQVGTCGLAAPFIPTIAGTTTYLDQLW